VIENFLPILFNEKSLIILGVYNLLPCIIFGIPLLLVQKFYPQQRMRRERMLVSFGIALIFLGAFLYLMPLAFAIVAILNLALPLSIILIFIAFYYYPHHTSLERKIIHSYLLFIPVISLILVSRFVLRQYLANPTEFDELILLGIFSQLGVMMLLFLFPVIGTLWLIKDTKRRREETKKLWKKNIGNKIKTKKR